MTSIDPSNGVDSLYQSVRSNYSAGSATPGTDAQVGTKAGLTGKKPHSGHADESLERSRQNGTICPIRTSLHFFAYRQILLPTTPQADDIVSLTGMDGVEVSMDMFVLGCVSRQPAE